MTDNTNTTPNAKTWIEDGNQGRPTRKLPIGSKLVNEHGRVLTVERSNGYVVTGYWDGIISRQGGLDLRFDYAVVAEVAVNLYQPTLL